MTNYVKYAVIFKKKHDEDWQYARNIYGEKIVSYDLQRATSKMMEAARHFAEAENQLSNYETLFSLCVEKPIKPLDEAPVAITGLTARQMK